MIKTLAVAKHLLDEHARETSNKVTKPSARLKGASPNQNSSMTTEKDC
jgi:hypothetical protein